jgi:tRNA G18 (ribose-2'-O)-methylase SpoU
LNVDDDQAEQLASREVGPGVGPGVGPWQGRVPDDPKFDPDLLRDGDHRNVIDAYRYWKLDAIVADLDTKRHPFHVAIENLEHDFNIGSIVRTSNAFLAKEIHIVGRKRWNRRGAMVTDRYQHIRHHDTVAGLRMWAKDEAIPIIGIDNVSDAHPLEEFDFPEACVLFFGQEGTGLATDALGACDEVVSISQFGSTRSINVGAAAAIAMHAWIRRRRFDQLPDTRSSGS